MIQTTLNELARMCKGQLINTEEDFSVSKVSIDTRNMDGAQIFIPIIGENFDGHSFIDLAFRHGALVSLFQKDYDYSMFKSPLILVDDTTEALGQLAKSYLELIGAKVVGVTGSNGKTSTKDIIASLLSVHYRVQKTLGNFNNEIGLPLTILRMPQDTQVAVLEMGMSALGEISKLAHIAPCDVAVITSIGSAHLMDLGSVENVVKAKLEITETLKDDGVLIINGDHPDLMRQVRELSPEFPVLTYGSRSHNQYQISSVSQFIDSIVFTCEGLTEDIIEVNLLGRFQAQNVVAACITANLFDIEMEELFEPLKHLEITGKRNEIHYVNESVVIDDSYKSNPEALKSALDLLSSYQYDAPKIAVLGDMLELGDNEVRFHQEISMLLNDLNINRIYTIGHLSRHFHDYTNIIGEHFDSQDELFNSLKPWINQPSTILVKASNSIRLYDVVDRLRKEVKKMKVAIMFGGKSSEYTVSLSSAYSTLQNFPHEDYELIQIIGSQDGHFYRGDFSLDEIESDTWMNNPTTREVYVKPGNNSQFFYLDNLQSFKVDVVFNMIHGKMGEDGVLQALLETGGIKYTGCDQESSILCYDKDITYRLLDLTDIKKPKYRTLTSLIKEADYYKLVEELGQKVVVKPAREGSSYGISIVDNYSDFFDGVQKALRYDSKVVVEEYIKGIEIGCAVLEKDGELMVGEVDEVELQSGFFDFEAKYEHKGSQIHCPARISDEISDLTKETSLRVFKLLGCRDFSRIDFFITDDNVLYFNEINTIPGFTSTSRYPGMMQEVGVSFKEVISTLIENAVNRND